MTWKLAWCLLLGLSCFVAIESQGTVENVARNQRTAQSSNFSSQTSDLAVDGNSGPCTHTNPNNLDIVNWWYVDLERLYLVDYVRITNRGDSQGYRLRRFKILGSNHYLDTENFNKDNFTNNYGLEFCAEQIDSVADGDTVNFTCSHMQARFIYIVKVDNGTDNTLVRNHQILTLCEVEVFAALVTTSTTSTTSTTLLTTTTTTTTPVTTTTPPVTTTSTPVTTTTPPVTTTTTPVTITTIPVTATTPPVATTTTAVTLTTTPVTTTTTPVTTTTTRTTLSVPVTSTSISTPTGISESTATTPAVTDSTPGTGFAVGMELYIGVGAAAGVLVILIVVLVIVVLFVRKKEVKSHEDTDATTDLTGVAVVETEPQSQSHKDKMGVLQPTLMTDMTLSKGFQHRTEDEGTNKQVAHVKPKIISPKPSLKKIEAPASNNSESELSQQETPPPSSTLKKKGEFGGYVRGRLQSGDGAPFKEEYESILKSMSSSAEAGVPKLKIKNRYNNILPYDKNRVKLQQVAGNAISTYINASYIKDYYGKKAYIAALGATAYTLTDTWRLIWECDVTLIIMLTRLRENNKDKCEQYWPSEGSDTYGDVTVTLDSSVTHSNYTVRTLVVTKADECRTVTHYQLTTWPDKSVPESLSSLLQLREVIIEPKAKGQIPVLVHCSAGVGRTGTLIALDILLDQADNEQQVDVRMCVTRLREQRMNMVQTLPQYIFLHEALHEIFSLGSTVIPCHNSTVVQINAQVLNRQFQFLETVKPVFSDENLQLGNFEYSEKNRDKSIVAADDIRLKISSCPEVYINAVEIKAASQDMCHIATQVPLPDTVTEFWRMVYEGKCHTLVCLQTDPEFQEWFPTDNKTIQIGSLTVTHSHIVENDLITRYDLKVKTKSMSMEYTNAADDNMAEYANVEAIRAKDEDEVAVHIFVLSQWTDLPVEQRDPSTLITLQEEVNKHQAGQTITVLCMDGATECGLYIALQRLCITADTEQEVDIFSLVKHLRTHRPQFIPTQAQFTFLHAALTEKIKQQNVTQNGAQNTFPETSSYF